MREHCQERNDSLMTMSSIATQPSTNLFIEWNIYSADQQYYYSYPWTIQDGFYKQFS